MQRLLMAICVALAALVAGCGGSSGGDSGGASQVGTNTKTEIPTDAKPGGDVTMLSGGDVDWIDPGQIYYSFGYQVQFSVHRTLYTFKPDDASKPVPDLAEGEPQVSADRKTITIKLRKGVRYAPPVDREIKAQDIKYAIERAFTSNVPSGYAFSYFDDIEGAPSKPEPIAKLEPFSGLQTPDDNTLVIKLAKPAPILLGALVMPITSPVPEEYASKFDAKTPTAYDQYATFTGPYMVKNDSKTGELVGRTPGKRIELVRNPNWDKATDFRPAYLNSITIEEGNTDTAVSARRTLAGQDLMCCGDASKPPASILKRALTRNEDQVGRGNSGGTRWSAFNTKKKPFDNVNVRRAIMANADRFALRKVQGGEAIGPIAQGYIIPGMPGFEESGGLDGFKDLDFMQHADGGSPEVARKYMDLAEKDGVPIKDGKYVGNAEIVGVVANSPDSKRIAETLAADMKELGFDLKIRQVSQETLYTKYCDVPKQEPHMCISIGWVKDFQDAQTLMSPIFPSDTILPAGNVNISQLTVPAVDAAIARAEKEPPGTGRNKAFAEANHVVVEQVPTLLTVWDDNISLVAKNVNGVINAYNGIWDLNYSSVK